MMKDTIRRLISSMGFVLIRGPVQKKYKRIYKKYKDFSMIPEHLYYENLFIAESYIKGIKGDVAECGVWRGGMSAGLAELFGTERKYFLFDSFEGLPDATELDGPEAKKYQEEKTSASYFNNCTAEIEFAQKAMGQTGTNYEITKGWFNQVLKDIDLPELALLRLDGDWYDSTMDCLISLYPKVVKGGIIIIDDYYTWDGCSRAIHDYLSQIKSISRINKSPNGICYIIKND